MDELEHPSPIESTTPAISTPQNAFILGVFFCFKVKWTPMAQQEVPVEYWADWVLEDDESHQD